MQDATMGLYGSDFIYDLHNARFCSFLKEIIFEFALKYKCCKVRELPGAANGSRHLRQTIPIYNDTTFYHPKKDCKTHRIMAANRENGVGVWEQRPEL